MSASSIAATNAAFIAAKEKSAAAASTTGAATATASKTDAAASQAQLGKDENFFLTMLTTQLKNQDPTSPMDTAQFTQQIAQYSGVQQQITTNANLEKLLAANKQSGVVTAVGYIGKEVETKGNTGMVVNGQGAFSYILPKAASSVKITLTDATGRTVFTGNGDIKSGRNIVVWDGVNSSTGQKEPDGTYKISIEASDTANLPMTAETRAVTLVSGVESDSSGNTLLTNGRVSVKFDEVLAVREPSRVVAQTETAG